MHLCTTWKDGKARLSFCLSMAIPMFQTLMEVKCREVNENCQLHV